MPIYKDCLRKAATLHTREFAQTSFPEMVNETVENSAETPCDSAGTRKR